MPSAVRVVSAACIALVVFSLSCATGEQHKLPYRSEVRVGMTQREVLQLYKSARDPDDANELPRSEVVDTQQSRDESRRTIRFWLLDSNSEGSPSRQSKYEPIPFLLTFAQYRPSTAENVAAVQRLVDELNRKGELTEQKMAELLARRLPAFHSDPVLISIECDDVR